MMQQKTPVNKTSLWVMIVVIIVLLIGILLRWEYISREVGESFRNRFPTEKQQNQKVP